MFYESSKIVAFINQFLSKNQDVIFKNEIDLRSINGKNFRQGLVDLNLSQKAEFFSKNGHQILYHFDLIKELLDADPQYIDQMKDEIALEIEAQSIIVSENDENAPQTDDNLRVFNPNHRNIKTPIANDISAQTTPEPFETDHISVNQPAVSAKLLRQTPAFSLQDQKFSLELPTGYHLLSKDDLKTSLDAGQSIDRVGIIQVDLSGEYEKNINFLFVHIKKLVINQAQFHKLASFVNCQIEHLIIKGSTFHQSFSLKNSKIKNISIDSSEFMQSFNAEKASFENKFIFNKVIFRQKLRFWEAVFSDWINWNYCEFHGEVDMRSTFCESGFCGKESRFYEDIKFRGMHLAMKWEAPQCTFEKLIDFSKAKLHDFVYLEDIIQGENQRWAFMNTISERILIRPAQVEGRLLSEEEGNYTQAMREYGILKKAFEHEHRYDDDDWAFYRFKVNERKAESTTRRFWEKPFGVIKDALDWLFLDWGCGYGTSPMRAVRSALLLILLFAVFYTVFFDKVHPIENLPFPHHDKNHILNQFGVSVLISVAAFTSGFGDLKEAVADWLNIPLMIEALLGTLMWGLFIVAFGRKVIR